MSPFMLEALRPDQIRAVYPLIREVVPDLTLPAWLRFARPLTVPRRAALTGIVTARRNGRVHPCGLFCYRVDRDLERGKVLIAEHFVAVDLLDPQAVLSALVAELEGLGTRLGCGAVRSVVHRVQADGITGNLTAAGHAPEAHVLLKSLLAEARPRPKTTVPTGD